MGVEAIAVRLAKQTAKLRFAPPVTHVYNPLEYAQAPCLEYLRRYGQPPRDVLLLGMNPGPFGMAQTGIPFGDVSMVRDWLGIEAPVGKPRHEHPKRLIEGFACSRSEVSGSRLWGWARKTYGSPEAFFQQFFVWNYCPLSFLEESGRNRTPDKLPIHERDPLLALCDTALQELVSLLQPKWVIGIGKFAERRARAALNDGPFTIGYTLHPSPANPQANRDWEGALRRSLTEYGIVLPEA